jgi:two-component system response regulator HydG
MGVTYNHSEKLSTQDLVSANNPDVSAHILFVDDEAPIRELLALFFRKKGWQVTTAMTAQEAKKLPVLPQISLAILDVNLAGENGLELLSFFRTNYPKMPVIIFTGLSGQDLVAKALVGGASGFMAKGDSLDSLFATVCRHLPQ